MNARSISRMLGKKFDRSEVHATRIKGMNMRTSGFSVRTLLNSDIVIEIWRKPSFSTQDISNYLAEKKIDHSIVNGDIVISFSL